MKPEAQAGKIRTPQEVRQEFRKHGVTVSRWADEKGFDVALVKDVLSGRVKGHYGKAHEIAVALGIKADPGRPPPFLQG